MADRSERRGGGRSGGSDSLGRVQGPQDRHDLSIQGRFVKETRPWGLRADQNQALKATRRWLRQAQILPVEVLINS